MASSIFKELNFHPIVAEWFKSRYTKPSPPQKKGWPSIAAGNHTLILAPTGSGKTLSAFLWSIDCLFRKGLNDAGETFNGNPEGIHTLYISPLKALNNDIQRNLTEPLSEIAALSETKGLNVPPIKAEVRTGDTPQNTRQKMLKNPPHILITTPESLYLLLTSGRGRRMFTNLQYVIIDEIHAISNNKRGVHLSLSLERLTALCPKEPVRIGLSATQKPLKRTAAYLGGQVWKEDKLVARRVGVVDCGQRKDMDLKLLSPVAEYANLPDDTVWPKVYELLYKLICSHKTTLIFANMRAQTERIARLLNSMHQERSGREEEILILAHHGSISREMRFDIEEKLKMGQIPAVIATASLELGIDIGSIDLVIQLEAPKDVSSALQRVGRSGHLLSAKSKGRIIPLYPADLDDAFALSRAMLEGDIEETTIPENALDVLSQQIAAEVSMREMDFRALFRIVRQSYCYRNLSENLFRATVDLLNGKFADNPIRYLQPRINYDQVNNRLIALRGTRQTAVLNSGTIPDRGYFSVRLKETNINLGEVEEEFVFERRVGESFYLGNSEWRIEEIGSDRIIVSPIAAIKPNAPFWKGGMLFRKFETSNKTGCFRSELLDKMERDEAGTWLKQNFNCDQNSVSALLNYFTKQKEQTSVIAASSNILAEWTVDLGGEPLFFLHAPFGAGVTGLWAIAVSSGLEKRFNIQVQYSFDDDGFMLRLSDTSDEPPLDQLLHMSADDAKSLILEALPDTAVFSVHFRYNAARSLLLPRSQPGKRIPLYLQRLRASDLFQAVRSYKNFPVILETYRECLNDVFDWANLKSILAKLEAGSIRIHRADTRFPSSMASGILSKFVAVTMYEYDQSRKAISAENDAGSLLRDILESDDLPQIITEAHVQKALLRWQNLAWEFRAADKESLFRIIEKLAPLADSEIALRSRGDWQHWLDILKHENRILHHDTPVKGWIPFNWIEEVQEGGSDGLILHILSSNGPLSRVDLQRRWPFDPADLVKALKRLVDEKKIIMGRIVLAGKSISYCLRENFSELYRMAIADRRKTGQALKRGEYYRFLFDWHHLTRTATSMDSVLNQYGGYAFPLHYFEREVLTTRKFQNINNSEPLFKEKIQTGQVIALAGQSSAEGPAHIRFIKRGEGNLFYLSAEETEQLKVKEEQVLSFLKENGACFWDDLKNGCSLSSDELQDSLKTLAKRSLISTDYYETLAFILNRHSVLKTKSKKGNGYKSNIPVSAFSRSRSPYPSRRRMVESYGALELLKRGRYFLTNSFAVRGPQVTRAQKAEWQAKLLLRRYGILVKEWYRHESGLLPWYELFQALKRMEWRGEIRRGYFIEGLSGLQFTSPEALNILEKHTSSYTGESVVAGSGPLMLSVVDPAIPFGKWTPWKLNSIKGDAVSVTRLSSNHIIFIDVLPVVYSESFGKRIFLLANNVFDNGPEIAGCLQNWLRLPEEIRPLKKIEIEQIDGQAASSHPFGQELLKFGFERDQSRLILWPSSIMD